MKESMASIAIVDDDQQRLRRFERYASERGDIRLKMSKYAADLADLVGGAENNVDAVILDVKLPKYLKELGGKSDPRLLPPRALELAQMLLNKESTSRLPVVVYTRYYDIPEVLNQLNILTQMPNVVAVFRGLEAVDIVLRSALTAIGSLTVGIKQSQNSKDTAFTLSGGGGVDVKEVVKGRICLNGYRPVLCQPISNKNALFVGFDVGARLANDINYLMVEVQGLKTVTEVMWPR